MKINYNGRQYGSPAELPAEGRELFERLTRNLADRDDNGVPDLLEGAQTDAEITLSIDQPIIINRRTYTSLADVPADEQRLLREMRGLFDRILEEPTARRPVTDGPFHSSQPAATSTMAEFAGPRSRPGQVGSPPPQDNGRDRGRGWQATAADVLWRIFCGIRIAHSAAYLLILVIAWVTMWLLNRYVTALIFDQ